MGKIKLYTVVSKDCDYIGLNQIITEWENSGLIDRIQIPMKRDKRYISWVGRIGGLAIEPSYVYYVSDPYEYVLSCQYYSIYKDKTNILPWNFYVRDWNSFKQVREKMDGVRNIKSIFSGTIRGVEYERQKWINSTEIFSYRTARSYNRTNQMFPTLADYYTALSKSVFALCPLGDCPICQRETETVGMGCVAMFTPGVEYNYFSPMIENEHFISVKNVDDMKNKIESMTEKEIKEISKNGMNYFDAYCKPDKMWDSVIQTVEKYNIKI
jgi:hypothetical protein